MGYVPTIPYGVYEFGNTHQLDSNTISNVAGTITFTPIVVPQFLLGGIEHAYLDAYFPFVENTNVGDNLLDTDTVIRVERNGTGIFTTAINMYLHTMTVPASSIINFGRAVGTHDIGNVSQACVKGGDNMNITWLDAKANLASLVLRNAYFVLRVLAK